MLAGVEGAVFYFNPRPPRGGRPPALVSPWYWMRFQSTPSARRATQTNGPAATLPLISIHALREEGDRTPPTGWASWPYFNPRPPRGGRRSRPPKPGMSAGYFNPRPPRGGRLVQYIADNISSVFQSTPSARRATFLELVVVNGRKISIHALREEGDCRLSKSQRCISLFQSTPSARRATRVVVAIRFPPLISIHALREEGDCGGPHPPHPPQYFNPRPPRGGRPRGEVTDG